jgi:uncharacterized membrane protein YeiH
MNEMLEFLKWPGAVLPSRELQTPLVAVLDLVGICVFASAGALAARGKQMDIVGLTVISIVSALGGGTIRDILLGHLPVFWMTQPLSVFVTILTGWLTFAVMNRVRVSANIFQFPDALGLALFTVVGAEKSLIAGHGWLVSALMGVVTAVFGGVLRDVICREIPSVFTRTELYATASLTGGLAYVVGRGLGWPEFTSVLVGITLVTGVRLAAIRWRWTLPTLKED